MKSNRRSRQKKQVKALVWAAAACVIAWGGKGGWRTACAAQTQATSEDLEASQAEPLEGDQEEIDRLLEEYFGEMDQEELDQGELDFVPGLSSNLVADPQLVMEPVKEGRIRYTLPNGNFYISSVPNGMITEKPVNMVVPAGAVGVAQKDDELAWLPQSWNFTEAGVYHITMLFYETPSQNVQDFNVYEVNHYFTIIGNSDGRLGAVPAPEGFRISMARRDGRSLKFENPACLFLEGDGLFEILYEDLKGKGITFKTMFRRDTIAPFLTFSKEPEKGIYTGPVEFFPSEADCSIYMAYNGSKGYAVGNTLTAAGNYELEIRDQTGNSRVYYLRIRQTYDLVDRRVIIMILIVLCGVAVRLVFLRRNMRVL